MSQLILTASEPSLRIERLLFPAATFMSAALVFSVEPLMGRLLTPLLGGGASVWTSSLVFFQFALLLGYLYAHLLRSLGNVRQQIAVHLGMLCAAATNIRVYRAQPNNADNGSVSPTVPGRSRWGRAGGDAPPSQAAQPVPPIDSSPEVIRLVVRLYVRYPLSPRNVEDLHERGIDIRHETVRLWVNRFGPMFAGEVRKRRVQATRQHTHWHGTSTRST